MVMRTFAVAFSLWLLASIGQPHRAALRADPAGPGSALRPTKLCQVVWADHFNDVTAVPDYFHVSDCKALASAQTILDAPGAHWFIGCFDPAIEPRFRIGADGGGLPEGNGCGWEP